MRGPIGVVDRVECLTEVIGNGVGGGDGVRPGLDVDAVVARAVLTNLWMDQPVWCSI
jgi:hypothetical protein